MAPIENLVAAWRAAVAELPDEELAPMRAALVERASTLVQDSQRAATEAARRVAELIPSGATVLTHSSSTVAEALHLLRGRATVIFTESRPRLEGHRLASWLSAAEMTGQLVTTDAQLGHFAAQADVALVGADSVLADGAVVNKVGTYLLALAARDHDLPFYVCFEGFKRTTRTAAEISLGDGPARARLRLPGILARRTSTST